MPRRQPTTDEGENIQDTQESDTRTEHIAILQKQLDREMMVGGFFAVFIRVRICLVWTLCTGSGVVNQNRSNIKHETGADQLIISMFFGKDMIKQALMKNYACARLRKVKNWFPVVVVLIWLSQVVRR